MTHPRSPGTTLQDNAPLGDWELIERWLSVPGWPTYSVSDHGRVRAESRIIHYRDGRKRQYPEHLMTPNWAKVGYWTVALSDAGRRQIFYVHDLVLTAFVGPRPDGMDGCHGSAGSTSNHLPNLRWDTHAENMLDTVRHGTNHARNRTHCPIEHLLQLPNLVAVSVRDGHRDCLACNRARANHQEAKKRGRPFDFRAAADEHYRKIMGVAA